MSDRIDSWSTHRTTKKYATQSGSKRGALTPIGCTFKAMRNSAGPSAFHKRRGYFAARRRMSNLVEVAVKTLEHMLLKKKQGSKAPGK